MASVAGKLKRWLPAFPRRRYGIFAGTTTWREWRQMLVSGRADPSEVARYEAEFAETCGVGHAVSFGAGRMALYAILEALDIGPGDEVVIPAFTCVVVPNAVLYRGATPVYVDIDPRTFNIDVSQIERAITPRTKSLYAQHTFGVPCDVDAIRALAKRHGLPVIEDVAHALGASYRGQPAGSLTEVAFVSTDHSKMISTHLGGMVLTNDDGLASRIRRIRDHASELDPAQVRRVRQSFALEFVLFAPAVMWLGGLVHKVLAKFGVLFSFRDEMSLTRPTAYPYPCRLSPVQARIGRSQLRALVSNLAHRRALVAELERRIGWYGADRETVNRASWLRYSFLVRNRGEFESGARRRFDLAVWFTSVVEGRWQDLESVGYVSGSCPIAEYVARHIVNLPTHPRVTWAAIDDVLRRVPADAIVRWSAGPDGHVRSAE